MDSDEFNVGGCYENTAKGTRKAHVKIWLQQEALKVQKKVKFVGILLNWESATCEKRGSNQSILAMLVL